MENKEKSFTDENGTSKVVLIGDNAPLNMPKNIILANRPKKENKHMYNVGPKSNGFAGVAALAIIIVVAALIVGFLIFKY